MTKRGLRKGLRRNSEEGAGTAGKSAEPDKGKVCYYIIY